MSAKKLKLALVVAVAVIVYLMTRKKPECPQPTQVTSTFIPGNIVQSSDLTPGVLN